MGQKVNPVSFRTGIVIGWKSRWYASKKDYSSLLIEDHKIRNFIKPPPRAYTAGKVVSTGRVDYKQAGIERIEIERTRDEVKVVMFVARPGLIIGKKGEEIERLQGELQDLIGRRVNLKIEEVSRPEISAQLVAEEIAQQLSRRGSFRRAMKRSMEQTMEAGAKGIKVQLAGRLGGAEMARREKATVGAMPLSTLQAKIDYGFTEAPTAQGNLGIQVWVNQGMHTGDSSNGPDAQESQAPKKPKRSYKR